MNSTLTGGTPAESTVCYVGEKKWAFKWHHMRARVNGWVGVKFEFATSMLASELSQTRQKISSFVHFRQPKQCLEQESNQLQDGVQFELLVGEFAKVHIYNSWIVCCPYKLFQFPCFNFSTSLGVHIVFSFLPSIRLLGQLRQWEIASR